MPPASFLSPVPCPLPPATGNRSPPPRIIGGSPQQSAAAPSGRTVVQTGEEFHEGAAAQVSGKWAVEKEGTAPRYRDGKWIVVDYGRPILRGRTDIFGTDAEYGKTVNAGAPVWRAGANQTTRFKTEAPLVFAGKTLPAGEYSVFVDLKPGAWTLVFSKQPHQTKYDPNNKTETWGSDGYDPKFDALRVPMQTSVGTTSIEQFTIAFINMTQQGGALALAWEKTVAVVAFTVGT
ncbi:MAG: DUF2911 domain-containing protein [Vicinamibacterales bacterium]|nr:DUF2911 domain-containing protein [Vicinamibacterales bacterium]